MIGDADAHIATLAEYSARQCSACWQNKCVRAGQAAFQNPMRPVVDAHAGGRLRQVGADHSPQMAIIQLAQIANLGDGAGGLRHADQGVTGICWNDGKTALLQHGRRPSNLSDLWSFRVQPELFKLMHACSLFCSRAGFVPLYQSLLQGGQSPGEY